MNNIYPMAYKLFYERDFFFCKRELFIPFFQGIEKPGFRNILAILVFSPKNSK